MKSSLKTVKVTSYVSEERPEIETTDERLAEVIAWADENPVAYKIVTSRRSKAFGLGSSSYMGWAQNSVEPGAVIERLAVLKHAFYQNGGHMPAEFWSWRAMFTLTHFEHEDFHGGLFQQHARWENGKEYARNCVILDFTTLSLERVLDRFWGWMNAVSPYLNTTRISVDGITMRQF